MSFDLLLAERLGQWVYHVVHRVDSRYLDELFLEVFACDVKLSLYILELLMRSELLSKCYGTVVIAMQCNGIRWHHNQLHNEILESVCFLSSSVMKEATMYSAFMVESTIIGCLKLFQLTNPPLHKKIHSDVDFPSSTLDMKSELVYPSTFSFDPPSKIKNKSLILLKYFRIFLTAIQCFSFGFD